MRVLESLAVDFEIKTYQVDESDLSAETVAQKIGLPLEQTYKTLCCLGDRHGHLFALNAGDAELDLKALARASDNRKCETVAMKELLSLTGYIRGGVTAIASKKPFAVYVDEFMLLHEVVSVSAGQRGIQLWLDPNEYVRATNAQIVSIARDKTQRPH